jgi:drug/metabolite transporter (DMT)-like permease
MNEFPGPARQLGAIEMRSNLADMSGTSLAAHPTSKTALFNGIAVLANSFGNLLLAMAMSHMPGFGPTALTNYVVRLLQDPYLLPGVALSAIYTLTQVSLFSWADLSFVVPCISTSYVASTLLGQFVLGEHVHLVRWLGVLLITLGVAMVAETPVATRPHPAQDGTC